MMLNINTLSFRVNSRVLVFTVVLFVVILSIFYYNARITIDDSAKESAIALAENAVSKIEQELRQLEMIPNTIASLMEISPIHRDTLATILESIVSKNDNVFGSAIAFEPNYFPEKGLYFAPYAYRDSASVNRMYLGGNDYEYFYMDWYQIPKTLNESYWSEPYYDEGGGDNLFSTYSVPFYTTIKGDLVFSGVVTVDLSLEWLRDIVNSVQIFDTGYAYLLSRNGMVITHPNMEYIMNESMFSLALERNSPEMWEMGLEMQQGMSRFREHGVDSDGQQFIFYYTPLPSSDWSLG